MTPRHITSKIPWDVETMQLSEDGRHLAFTTNEAGCSHLYLLDTANDNYREVPGLAVGVIRQLAFHADSHMLAFEMDSARSPLDVYVYDLDSGKLQRWTQSETGVSTPAASVCPAGREPFRCAPTTRRKAGRGRRRPAGRDHRFQRRRSRQRARPDHAVPVRTVYLTTGPNRTLHLGLQTVELRHAPQWQLTMAHRPAGEAVRALAWLGASHAEAALRTIKRKLPPEAFKELVSAGHLLPPWLAQSVSKLAAPG